MRSLNFTSAEAKINYYERHLGDYARDTAHLSMIEHGAYTLLLDRYYATEAGIPEDQAHRVARARSKDEKQAVDAVLNEFFSLVDGVWIKGRVEEEIAKCREKQPQAQEKRDNDKERQRRARERRKQLFEALTSHGIHMPWNATTDQLQAELLRVTSQPSHGPVTRDNTATRHQTPDTSNQTPVEVLDTHTVTPTAVARDFTPTPAGLACKAMREAGIPDGNPSHPTLQALCEAGATEDEFMQAAIEAKGKGKGFSYALGIVKGRREEAATLVLHQGKFPNKQEAIENRNREIADNWRPAELEIQHANG